MEDLNIGKFIRDRRIELGMTQQQLADRLGITDKAVSKWERGVSYPDITILRELSAALEVGVTELLAGERDRQPPDAVPPEVQEVVVDTVSYAETARRRNSGWKFWTFIALTSGCLVAVLVLLIVGWANRCLGNVMIAIRAIAFGWAVCYPLLRTERYPIRNSLAIASVFIYPLVRSFGAHRGFHLGIVVVSVAYAWSVYWAAWRYRERKNIAIALVILLGGILQISINIMARGADLTVVMIVTAVTLFLDLLCLAGTYVLTAQRVKI